MPTSIPVIQRSSQLIAAALLRHGLTEEAVKGWNPDQDVPPPLGTGGMTFAIRASLRAIDGDMPSHDLREASGPALLSMPVEVASEYFAAWKRRWGVGSGTEEGQDASPTLDRPRG